MAEGQPETSDTEKLDELIEKAEAAVEKYAQLQDHLRGVVAAVTADLAGEGPTDGEGSQANKGVLLVRVATKEESRMWRGLDGASKILSPLAVVIAVLGFMFTIIQYNKRVDELNANTLYNVAREARSLGKRLADNDASTAEGINFHYTVFYLEQNGAIANSLEELLLLDYCDFTKGRNDFDIQWSGLKAYYPEDFVSVTDKLVGLPNCTSERIKKISNKQSRGWFQ